MAYISRSELKLIASKAGLSLHSLVSPALLEADQGFLECWQNADFAGQMQYMRRESALLANPLRLLENAKSIACFLVNYPSLSVPNIQRGFGRVARYAWGQDYHLVIKSRLQELIKLLEEKIGSFSYRIFSDAVPLLERALARQAGLGFIGNNSMLIRPGIGSFFFLAEIIWDLESDLEVTTIKGGCGTCQRCKVDCPTNAIVEDRKIDARRCISYLSIEKRGNLENWERQALGEWIFGCDICQEVCPFNHRSLKSSNQDHLWDELKVTAGVGPYLDLSEVLGMRAEADFKKRFAKTALLRTKREGLVRNAAIVAANTLAENLEKSLLEAFQNDLSPVVRQTSLWALSKLISREKLKIFAERALKDPQVGVRQEALFLLEN